MAPWNWRNPCTSAATDSDESTQTPPPTLKREQNDNIISAIQTKSGKKFNRCTHSNSSTANNSGQNQKVTSTKSTTPVLFSTNRGLYLRVSKSMSKSCVTAGECVTCSRSPTPDIKECPLVGNGGIDFPLASTGAYEIRFCDLERWSTNRANTISLEDTFIVSRRNDDIPSPIEPTVDNNNAFPNQKQRSGSIFCVPSGSRHALVLPRRSLYQRSTSIQSTFERFGVQ